MSWTCPHQQKKECARLKKECKPLQKGCVLKGEFLTTEQLLAKHRAEEEDTK